MNRMVTVIMRVQKKPMEQATAITSDSSGNTVMIRGLTPKFQCRFQPQKRDYPIEKQNIQRIAVGKNSDDYDPERQ
jgi:hypothetical protein